MDRLYDRVCIVIVGFGSFVLMKYGLYTLVTSGA